jgi:hypothetical protein
MAHAANGKLNVKLRCLTGLFLYGVFDDAAACRAEGRRALGKASHHRYRTKGSGLPQKIAPVKGSTVHPVFISIDESRSA